MEMDGVTDGLWMIPKKMEKVMSDDENLYYYPC